MGIYYQRMAGLLKNPRLYSTVHVVLVDAETNEVTESLYDEAAEYQADIAREMASFRTTEYPTNNLMEDFELPDDPAVEKRIRQKISSARPTVEAVEDTLYGVLELEMADDLTEEEFLRFSEQIRSQYRDGWGAEFELLNIGTNNDEVVSLLLYQPDMDFYTADAFNRLQQQKKEQEIQTEAEQNLSM